jgi:hypothetical protein
MPDQQKRGRLLGIFDASILWNKAERQVTVSAEITEATLHAV